MSISKVKMNQIQIQIQIKANQIQIKSKQIVSGFGAACCCFHLEWDARSRKWRLGFSSLLQFNAVWGKTLLLLLWHPGPDISLDWMEQIGNKKSAVWAGLSLNGHCGVDCSPGCKDLWPLLGIVVACHSWAWTLVPPSHVERGPVLGFKPRGAVVLAGAHGRNVRSFQPEQLGFGCPAVCQEWGRSNAAQTIHMLSVDLHVH